MGFNHCIKSNNYMHLLHLLLRGVKLKKKISIGNAAKEDNRKKVVKKTSGGGKLIFSSRWKTFFLIKSSDLDDNIMQKVGWRWAIFFWLCRFSINWPGMLLTVPNSECSLARLTCQPLLWKMDFLLKEIFLLPPRHHLNKNETLPNTCTPNHYVMQVE